MSPAYDLIIVGGGIMGASTAYHLLSSEPNLKLTVVEKDPLYTYASTPLSLGNVTVGAEEVGALAMTAMVLPSRLVVILRIHPPTCLEPVPSGAPDPVGSQLPPCLHPGRV